MRGLSLVAPMVVATLNGNKTNTRRALKTPPVNPVSLGCWQNRDTGEWEWAYPTPITEDDLTFNDYRVLGNCPYGKPGDRLYIKEGLRRHGERWFYAADNAPVQVLSKFKSDMLAWAHHKEQDFSTARFMPRWAARIFIELTDVRVERLQEISDADALAEGCSARLLGELLSTKAKSAKIYPPHWVVGYDESVSFCRRCGEKKVRELQRGKAKTERGDIFLDGGWSQEADSVQVCETCGRLLDYTLTDYGVESELEHFEEWGFGNSAREAYQGHRMLSFDGYPILTERDNHPEWRGRVARLCLRHVWDRLHKADGFVWQTNPWVWALTYKVVSE